MNVKITSVILIFISLVLCSFLVSCLGFDSIIVQHRILDKNTYASAQTSDFDGPWADLFARIVRGTATSNYVDEKDINFIYNILKDSKISDSEFQEIQSNMKTCLANRGFDSKFGGPDVLGSYIVITPNYSPDIDSDYKKGIPVAADKAKSECISKTSYSTIATLYYMMLWNPQREDLSSYSADCLVKLKAVKQGFTTADFKEVLGGPGLPITSGSFGHADEIPGARDTIQDYNSDTKENTMSIPFDKWNRCTLNPKATLSEK